MPRLTSFLLGMSAGAMLCFGATNYHLVRAQDGFHLVPKSRARLAESYVDVRTFGISDWSNHTELAADLVAANKQQVLGGTAANLLQSGLNELPSWPRP